MLQCIKRLSETFERAILFNSLFGKDSIALTDACSKYFKEVVCVYMYTIKGSQLDAEYVAYYKGKYPNLKFIFTPTIGRIDILKNGLLGNTPKPYLKTQTMASIDKTIRDKTGIDLSIYGYKMSDSIVRRLMLKGYNNCQFCPATNKAYPLAHWKNKDVIRYIEENDLIRPFVYYSKSSQSGSYDISDPEFLIYMRTHYPTDFKIITEEFPATLGILYEYENKEQRAEGSVA